MVFNIKNLGVAFSDSKSRVIFLIIFVASVTAIGIGVYEIRSQSKSAVASNVQIAGAPQVQSIPGVGTTPSREYVKLQEQQNAEQVRRAERTGTSAVPTIIRASYFGQDQDRLSGDFVSPDSTAPGCDVASLRRARQAGVSAFELRCRGCSVKALRSAGYTAGELREAGFSASELKRAGFNAAELKAAGFNAVELKQAGFPDEVLRKIGFSKGELDAADAVLASSNVQCDPASLKRLRSRGVSAAFLKQSGCSAAALRAAGYTARELKAAGFTAEDLRAAGFTPQQIQEAGYACDLDSLKAERARGVSAKVLKERGCGAAALKAAGYTARELRDAGFSAADLKRAGFSTAELKAAGFSAKDLKDAGFTDKQIREAGYACDVKSLMEARSQGVSAKVLKERGCGAAALRAAGYTAGELRDAGFSAADLKKAGFSAAELKAAGFSAKDLKDAGFSAEDLKAAGFTASQLKAAGFTAGELKRAGFTAAQLKNAGFTPNQLRKAGFTADELKQAGFSAEALRKAGYTRGDLLRAGVIGSNEDLSTQTTPVSSNTVSGTDAVGSNQNTNAQTQNLNGLDVGGSVGDDSGQSQKTDAERALVRLQQRQAEQISAQERQARVQQMQQGMSSQASQLISSWYPPVTQSLVVGVPSTQKSGVVEGAAGNLTAGVVEGQNAQQRLVEATTQRPPTVKAGTVMFAVLLTGINSDEPSPVMATIVQGRFKGGKLLGKFKREGQKAVINFTTLSLPNYDNSISINAVAIDQYTARTAIADHVNNHYMLRYGTLFASSFLSGLADALSQSGTTSNFSEFGVQVQQEKLKDSELGLVALGNVGKEYGNQLKENFTTPPTVKVFSGTGIGILFMQDLILPLSKKTDHIEQDFRT